METVQPAECDTPPTPTPVERAQCVGPSASAREHVLCVTAHHRSRRAYCLSLPVTAHTEVTESEICTGATPAPRALSAV